MCARLSLNEPSGHSRQRETNQNANLTQSDANEFREVSIVPVNDRLKTDQKLISITDIPAVY